MRRRCYAFRFAPNDYRLPFPAARWNAAQSAAKRTDFPPSVLPRTLISGQSTAWKSRPFDLAARIESARSCNRTFSTAAIIYAGHKRRLCGRYRALFKHAALFEPAPAQDFPGKILSPIFPPTINRKGEPSRVSLALGKRASQRRIRGNE